MLMENEELDAWIAEHVMGWEGCKVMANIGKVGHPRELSVPSDGTWWSFMPSTDIAAAWQVVKKMEERDLMVTIVTDKKDGAECYMDDVTVGIQDAREVYVAADTVPLAICLAAKKLIEKKGRENDSI